MMSNPTQPKTTITKSAHVGTVVQEYMDNLLVDLFSDAVTETQEAIEVSVQPAEPELTVAEPVVEQLRHDASPINVVAEPVVDAQVAQQIEEAAEHVDSSQTVDKIYEKPVELRYPKAPVWAQQAFDVLLFDVCGLKLAVPMESLGKIIKVEHETNQLIGRPDWFIGAYIDHEQHLYVVDTAQYIMPEKGFNLADDGFDYVIQLQRSKWTLACKKVHSTVRLEPDQVKWRSQQGKRKWLSGTVVDHMCALIHVDSLIDLLEAEVK
jgi:purine-binding chemotaxis protein CheW